MTTCQSIDSIWVGERDRKPDDVTDLMVSMTEVGLLHPIVVTPDLHLVAGGRRLEAARRLGWTEIDVTVISSLADAELALRAEQDENTCRRDLTPVEAERARKRRAKVLAPLAEQRKKSGQPSPKLGEGSDRRTTKVAAQGTGYSGTTLDKVAEVAEIAGDVTRPEAVRAVARDALIALDKPKAAVDPARKAVRRAEQEHAEATLRTAIDKRLPNAAAEDAAKTQRARWSRLISAAAEINTMSAEAVAAVLTDSEFAAAQITVSENARFLARVTALRTRGLHAVGED